MFIVVVLLNADGETQEAMFKGRVDNCVPCCAVGLPSLLVLNVVEKDMLHSRVHFMHYVERVEMCGVSYLVGLILSVVSVGVVGGVYRGRGTQQRSGSVQMLDPNKSGKEGPKQGMAQPYTSPVKV